MMNKLWFLTIAVVMLSSLLVNVNGAQSVDTVADQVVNPQESYHSDPLKPQGYFGQPFEANEFSDHWTFTHPSKTNQ